MQSIQAKQRGTLPCLNCSGTGVCAPQDVAPMGKYANLRQFVCPMCQGTGKIELPEIKHGPDYLEPMR